MGLSFFGILGQVPPDEASGSRSTRTKRGKTKLPTSTRCWHIDEFDQVGEPVSPVKVLGPYKSVIGALVWDFIPLKYRKWNGKEDNPWRVPESDKDAIWENV